MARNPAGKTALGREERPGEGLADWSDPATRTGPPGGVRPVRRGAEPSGKLHDESTGAILERELLLVQPPMSSRVPVGSRRLARVLALACLLLAAGAGAAWGLLELERSWQERIAGLEAGLDELAAENAAQETFVVELRKETQEEIRARQTENRELAELVQKTLRELETTVEHLQEVRAENDLLEERYRRLREESEKRDLRRILERLVPRWLRDVKANRP